MVMSKAGSSVILMSLLGRENEINIDSLPWGPDDERVPAGIETVVEATPVRPARGMILEEVLIKREAGGPQRIVVDHMGDGIEDGEDGVVEIKVEPGD